MLWLGRLLCRCCCCGMILVVKWGRLVWGWWGRRVFGVRLGGLWIGCWVWRLCLWGGRGCWWVFRGRYFLELGLGWRGGGWIFFLKWVGWVWWRCCGWIFCCKSRRGRGGVGWGCCGLGGRRGGGWGCLFWILVVRVGREGDNGRVVEGWVVFICWL